MMALPSRCGIMFGCSTRLLWIEVGFLPHPLPLCKTPKLGWACLLLELPLALIWTTTKRKCPPSYTKLQHFPPTLIPNPRIPPCLTKLPFSLVWVCDKFTTIGGGVSVMTPRGVVPLHNKLVKPRGEIG